MACTQSYIDSGDPFLLHDDFAMNRFRTLSILLPAALLALAAPSHAQRPNLSAREAIGLVSSQFGPQAVAWIAEMRAQGGVPQPSDWQVLAYDQRAPRLLYRFWAGGGRAGDGGIDEQRYPDDVPFGYFNASQIGVDSVAAFTIAEGEARKAKMAFDSCDYLLRLREYSTEPVWRLELLDAARRMVGKLYISAGNGEVLRTVWIYRDQRARPDGLPLIIDSMAPGASGAPTDLSSLGYPSADAPVAAPPASVPGQVPGQVPGSMMGIHSVPLPPAPGVPVAGNQPYAPVDAMGRPVVSPPPAASNDGIPAPPPITQAPSAPAMPSVPAPPIPAPPAPAPAAPVTPAPVPAPPAPAPAPSMAKPAIKPSAGDSERIPPPPIPPR